MAKEEATTTISGIPLKVSYAPEDVAGQDYNKDLGNPGEFPYTRGIYPQMYRFQPWMMLQLAGFETMERTRERMEMMFKEGHWGYEKFGIVSFNLIPDVCSCSAAIDPDDPLARGLVGRCGASIASIKDMEYFLDGLPLDKLHLSIISHSASPGIYALWVGCVQESGLPTEIIRGDIVAAVDEGFLQGRRDYSPEGALRIRADMIKYAVKHTPQINFNIEMYQIRDAGANAVQEIAFGLARGIASLEECIKRGVEVNEAARVLTFHMGLHNDFFEEIAKLRAFRRMWSKLLKDRFNATKPQSMRPKIFIQTSGSTLTWQQPLNNIVRTTVQALAAILGGTNALSVDCLDEAHSIPSAFAEKQSLRIQQILLHESNVASVVDPLAGSYFIESLTNELEERAYQYIDDIDKMGGWTQAIRRGYIKNEVEKSSHEYSKQIWDDKRVIVGVNKYQEGEEIPIPLGHEFVVDEEAIIERIKEFKRKRDNEKVKKMLGRIKEAAMTEDADITPVTVEAARAHVTMGEICGVLKEVFEWKVW